MVIPERISAILFFLLNFILVAPNLQTKSKSPNPYPNRLPASYHTITLPLLAASQYKEKVKRSKPRKEERKERKMAKHLHKDIIQATEKRNRKEEERRRREREKWVCAFFCCYFYCLSFLDMLIWLLG
jgi:hypothetical protein